MALTDADMPQLLAMLNQINIRMQQRRKLAADWTSSNEVLREGEIGVETDTGREKTGDGTTGWNALQYQLSGPAVDLAGLVDGDTPIWDAAGKRWNHGPGGKVYQPGTGIAIANPSSATPTISSTLGSIAVDVWVDTYASLPASPAAGMSTYGTLDTGMVYGWDGTGWPAQSAGIAVAGLQPAVGNPVPSPGATVLTTGAPRKWLAITIDGTPMVVPAFGIYSSTPAQSWRVTTALEVAEMALMRTVGTPQLATGGTAYASSQYSSAYSADKAFDGSLTSLWAAASSPAWLGYKLASAQAVNAVSIRSRSDGYTPSTGASSGEFDVQSSNDSTNGSDGTWKTEWHVSTSNVWAQGETRVFARP